MSRLFSTLATLFHALQCFGRSFFSRAVSLDVFLWFLYKFRSCLLFQIALKIYIELHTIVQRNQAILWLVRFFSSSFISSKLCLAPVLDDLMLNLKQTKKQRIMKGKVIWKTNPQPSKNSKFNNQSNEWLQTIMPDFKWFIQNEHHFSSLSSTIIIIQTHMI